MEVSYFVWGHARTRVLSSLSLFIRKHVFCDLRPYVCLSQTCTAADQEFERRNDWSHHMREEHWKTWTCQFGCEAKFTSVAGFRRHLATLHVADISEQNIDSIVSLSGSDEFTRAEGACPLCLQVEIKSHRQYHTHVGHHLEQLALFALPSSSVQDEDNPSEDENEVYMNEEHLASRDRLPQTYKETDPKTHGDEAVADSVEDRSKDATASHPTDRQRQNAYFVPRDGIERVVIAVDICGHLGNDALVRPGTYEDPRTGQLELGYYITSYRNLTTVMIQNLKDDSARWHRNRFQHRQGVYPGRTAPGYSGHSRYPESHQQTDDGDHRQMLQPTYSYDQHSQSYTSPVSGSSFAQPDEDAPQAVDPIWNKVS